MRPKPHLKNSPHTSPKVQSRSNHLKLVVPGNQPAPKRSSLAWPFVVMAVVILGYSWSVGKAYFSTTANWNALDATSPLLSAFQTNGIEGYLVAKARLREQVRSNLKYSEGDPRHEAAEQIAVYLFPGLLPESNFERMESLEIFAPQIEAIERRPRTEESQQAFNALKAEIWNYENFDHEAPEISELGNQLLNILEIMARL